MQHALGALFDLVPRRHLLLCLKQNRTGTSHLFSLQVNSINHPLSGHGLHFRNSCLGQWGNERMGESENIFPIESLVLKVVKFPGFQGKCIKSSQCGLLIIGDLGEIICVSYVGWPCHFSFQDRRSDDGSRTLEIPANHPVCPIALALILLCLMTLATKSTMSLSPRSIHETLIRNEWLPSHTFFTGFQGVVLLPASLLPPLFVVSHRTLCSQATGRGCFLLSSVL